MDSKEKAKEYATKLFKQTFPDKEIKSVEVKRGLVTWEGRVTDTSNCQYLSAFAADFEDYLNGVDFS